jgi:hypothetical protein
MAVISISLNPRPSESSAVKIRIGIRVYSRSFAVKIGTNPRSSGLKAPPTKTNRASRPFAGHKLRTKRSRVPLRGLRGPPIVGASAFAGPSAVAQPMADKTADKFRPSHKNHVRSRSPLRGLIDRLPT